MSWKKETSSSGGSSQAPPGYRDHGRPLFADSEVLSSTYQVRSLLHSDDSGQVFEAWDMALDRPVAIKAVWRDPGVPPLLPQARAARAVGHECAADVYALGHHRGTEFLVAERIAAPTLRERLAETYGRGASLDAETAIDLLARLAQGLAAVHGAGMNLGDLAAENILVTPAGRVVLCRFALGQGELRELAVHCFAPEVLRGVQGSDAAALVAIDLYALGIVACELLTGEGPYQGDRLQALEFAHVRQRPPVLAAVRHDIPTELSDLAGELLAKEPAARPKSAAHVARQLRTIAERASSSRRILRVLVVDHDSERVRPLWSVLRRAYSRTVVDAAVDAEDARHKVVRDRPDLVLLASDLPGDMNALELCVYLQGSEEVGDAVLIVLADGLEAGDSALLAQMGVTDILERDAELADKLTAVILDLARTDGGPGGDRQRSSRITG